MGQVLAAIPVMGQILIAMGQRIVIPKVEAIRTIDILPDEVLLEVFDFYVGEVREIEAWQLLAHVCRRWRNLLFGSARRLNLQLVFTPRTPARALDVWPAFPLVIQGHISPTSGVDNTVIALRHSSYTFKIDLWGSSGPASEEVLAAMQQPFPEITHLRLGAYDAPVVPDSFLDGSAPRLQYLRLERIPFPGLPKLLSSAIYLVELHLQGIPHSGYLSPEVMVTCLSALTSLERLSLGFQSPQSYPNGESRRPPPPTRSILPTLTYFQFRGVCEYLDHFVARIDTPRLRNLHITFFNQIDFDTPQLAQFISRTPMLNGPDEAHVIFHHEMVIIRFLSLSSTSGSHAEFHVEISCCGSEWQLSSLTQVCTLCLPPLSTVGILRIEHLLSPNRWENGIEDAEWLNFLRPFEGAKRLYLSSIFTSGVGSSLKGLIGDRIMEVLPTLQIISSKSHKIEGIEQFVDARQLSGHPITISLEDSPPKLDWLEVMRVCLGIPSPTILESSLPVSSQYRIRKTLGSTTYGILMEAVNINTDKLYTCKKIDKKSVEGQEFIVRNQIAVLKRVLKGHQNIVTLYDHFETSRDFYLVFDWCNGGNLFDRICAKGNYRELDAAELVRTIMKAVKYLHDSGIVHRNLKPENMLFRTSGGWVDVMIANFDLCRDMTKETTPLLTDICGTPGYMAPEILKKTGHGKPVDIWAMGVVTYFLLAGYGPFNLENRPQPATQVILSGGYNVQLGPAEECWADVSQTAKEFIATCLTVDPIQRPTAAEVLKHRWLTDEKPHLVFVAEKYKRERQAFLSSTLTARLHKLRENDTPLYNPKP